MPSWNCGASYTPVKYGSFKILYKHENCSTETKINRIKMSMIITYLSILILHTMPNTSTECSSRNCRIPILIAIKQPVRPMPALEKKKRKLKNVFTKLSFEARCCTSLPSVKVVLVSWYNGGISGNKLQSLFFLHNVVEGRFYLERWPSKTGFLSLNIYQIIVVIKKYYYKTL